MKEGAAECLEEAVSVALRSYLGSYLPWSSHWGRVDALSHAHGAGKGASALLRCACLTVTTNQRDSPVCMVYIDPPVAVEHKELVAAAKTPVVLLVVATEVCVTLLLFKNGQLAAQASSDASQEAGQVLEIHPNDLGFGFWSVISPALRLDAAELLNQLPPPASPAPSSSSL